MRTTDVLRVTEINKLFSRPDNYNEIKEDIEIRGIQEAVVVNTKNELLCGYTRVAIAEDLHIEDIPSRTVEVVDYDEMVEFAILDNIRRRQLSDLQLVEFGMRLEKLYSYRQGQRSDLQSQSGNLWTECPEVKENGNTRDLVAGKIQDKTGVKMSGRKYDRLKTIATKAVPEVKDKLNSREITQKEALALTKVDPDKQVEIIQAGVSKIMWKVKKVKKDKAKQAVKDKGKDFEPIPEVKILAGDMAVIGKQIDDNSVDLILTDPPYTKEFLPEWRKLANFAERVLKPSGFLIAYSGKMYLDKIIPILSTKLDYYWLISLLHTGHTKLEYSRHVNELYKPIIVFVKPPFKPVETYFKDAIKGSGRSKDLHEWQQGVEELYPLLDTFSQPGDTVVDPFAGSGTTLVAAYQKDRRAIGIEIDEETVKVIKGRLASIE